MKKTIKLFGIIVFLAIIGDFTSGCQEAENIPGIPAGITVTATSSSSITISWNSVTGSTGYRIFRSMNSNGTFTEIGTSTTTSFTDTELTASTTYY